MRIKLSANSPLPQFKAWYPVHGSATQTIASLKNTLCASLAVFQRLNPSSLQLSIDGFELLESSDLSVLRDGDLVHVDLVDATSRVTVSTINAVPSITGKHALHRPITPSVSRIHPGPSTSRKRKRRLSTPVTSSGSESDTEASSSSASSTSSASGSESESESDSDTSDTSESESGSESESSAPPIQELAKTALAIDHERDHRHAKPLQQPKSQAAPLTSKTFVPPGYGKPQTRARNLRRRLKRQHANEAATAPSTSGPASGANAVVSGTETTPQWETTTPTAPDATHSALDLPSLSLRNKNKAKNFRSLIGKPLPPKIIFADEEVGVSGSTSGGIGTPDSGLPTAGSSKSGAPAAVNPRSLPPLIPPSSRSSLPPNMFVTSIDVEAGLHRNRKKRKMRVEYGDELEEAEEHGGDVTLDYGNADADTMDIVPSESQACEMDVGALESKANQQWTKLEKLTDKQQVVPGCVVGYKALGINPVTYTPEYLLTLVGVQRLDGESLVVRPLRPSAEVSFGGPVAEDEEGEEEVEHSWGDIVSGDWRIVQRTVVQ